MHRFMIGVSSAVVLAALAAIPATAHEVEPLCNGVIDSAGEPVVGPNGEIVSHAASVPCTESTAVVEGEADEEVALVDTQEEPAADTAEPLVVYFDVNDASLSDEAEASIAAYADDLLEGEPSRVTVAGFTDTSGSAALNEALSQQRSENVAAALIENGVPAELIDRASQGEDSLATDTPDGTREPNNRRVVVTPVY